MNDERLVVSGERVSGEWLVVRGERLTVRG